MNAPDFISIQPTRNAATADEREDARRNRCSDFAINVVLNVSRPCSDLGRTNNKTFGYNRWGSAPKPVSIEQVYHFGFVLCFSGSAIYTTLLALEDVFVIEDT